MKDEHDFIYDIERQTQELEEFLDNELLDIIEVEGLNHFEESFDNEGFIDETLEKWEPRKTTDTRGRDITRYRTNRVGRSGELNRYGSKNQGRKILTGHDTGGNKLKNSLRASQISGGVDFLTDKEYGERHNEGLDGMPKRQFMGESKKLNDKVLAKVDDQLDQIFKG